LDDLLGSLPVQHRERQSKESALFLSYFPKLKILSGGNDSGFAHVKPEEYKPRLLHVKGLGKHVRIAEVKLSGDSLNEGDVFVLDNGLLLYQWQGKDSGAFEKRKAAEYIVETREERLGKPKTVTLDSGDKNDDFWKLLGGQPAKIATAKEGGDDAKVEDVTKQLYALVDEGAKGFTSKLIAKGKLDKKALDTKDVFLVDVGHHLFVWVGKQASKVEKHKAPFFADAYIKEHKLSPDVPVSRLIEDGETVAFWDAFGVGSGS